MWSKPKIIALEKSGLKIVVYDTGNIHSDTQAAKPVLFFVHGLGLNSFFWKYAIEHLRADYRCITIDLPGHGASREQRSDFSMTFYAQVLRECIEEMQLGEITLVGHSMGGQISIITALQIPAIVQRLILVCSAGIEIFTADEAQKIIQGAEYFYRAPADINSILTLYAPNFSAHAERIRELADDHITQQTEHFAAFSEMIVASVKGMLHEPVVSFLPHIHQPTLILYGDKDQLIPNKWVHPLMSTQQIEQSAKTKILKSQSEMIAGCGHYLPFEQPSVFAEKVHQFCLSTEN